jgi:hypothetical protein
MFKISSYKTSIQVRQVIQTARVHVVEIQGKPLQPRRHFVPSKMEMFLYYVGRASGQRPCLLALTKIRFSQ